MKILLISYYFYPCGVIGAKRWSEFYRLSKNSDEVEFTVLTANWDGKKQNDANIHYIGESVEYIPPKSINKKYSVLDVLKHPTIAFRSLDRSLFSNWKKQVKKWIDDNNKNNYDVIISTYSPAVDVVLGSYAKKTFKCPYILDLRDLISIQGQKKRVFLLHHLDMFTDKILTRDVDLFLTVSPTARQKAAEFYKKNVFTIYNGIDEIFETNNTKFNFKKEEPIKILYAGTLGKTRNPKKILEIMNGYAKNNNLAIEVIFASQDNPFEFINKKNVSNIDIQWVGYVSKKELKKHKLATNFFLLLEDLSSAGNENITGKLFEYICEEKPILASCNKGSDIFEVLNNVGCGTLIEKESDMTKILAEGIDIDYNKLAGYKRVAQYKNLIKILRNI